MNRGSSISFVKAASASDRLKAAILILVFKDLVAEEFVIFFPVIATVVDHALGCVVVTIEIAFISVFAGPIELHVLINELTGLTDN